MRPSVFFLLSTVGYIGSVGAGLYPTRPIANTLFHGGQWNDVNWIDHGPDHSLYQLGILSIQLWWSDISFLAVLADDVYPEQMNQSVFIPSNLWGNGSHFVIRFASINETIYTADFTITNMTGNRTTRLDEKFRQPLYSSMPTSAVPSSTPGGGYNDEVTVTMEMPDSSVAPFSAETTAGTVGAMANGAANGGRHVRRPSMHFNFVFVFFPALFGFALAI